MSKTIYRTEYATLLRMLREARLAAGITQIQCSVEMGRSQSFVSDIERGIRRLDIVQLRDLCRVFGITLTEFVTEFENDLAAKGTQHKNSSKKRRRKRSLID